MGRGGFGFASPHCRDGHHGGAGTWKRSLAGARGSGRARPVQGSPRIPPPGLPFRWLQARSAAEAPARVWEAGWAWEHVEPQALD